MQFLFAEPDLTSHKSEKLAAKAEKEGVSLNTLVVSLIAEGLGRRAS